VPRERKGQEWVSRGVGASERPLPFERQERVTLRLSAGTTCLLSDRPR
jgi:hypothetical protein